MKVTRPMVHPGWKWCGLLGFSLGLGVFDCPAQTAAVPEPVVPEDLLDDEHVREEFGVNQFTAPSIRRVFEDLEALGKVDFEKTHREIPEGTPRDRAVLALSLGSLIAEGFLVVTSERVEDLEPVGRAILKHAKVLGAGMRVTRHTKSLLENSALGDWDQLKEELAATQSDVEAELVLLRDIEVAHLIAFGGWLRAFEIATTAAMSPYAPEKAGRLARVDVVEYFLYSIEGFHPSMHRKDYIIALKSGLAELRDMMDVPEGKTFSEEEVQRLHERAVALNKVVENARATN